MRGLAFDLDELRHVCHRVEDDDEFMRKLKRQEGLFACWKLDEIEREVCDPRFEIVWEIDAGAPEHLSVKFGRRKFVRRVGSDPLLRIEAVLGRERQHVDAVEVAIVTMLDQLLDLVDGLWIGRLPQSGYKRCLSHEGGPLGGRSRWLFERSPPES